MTANTGKGRPPGSRNKLTLETLALVADGMGGAKAGEQASRIASEVAQAQIQHNGTGSAQPDDNAWQDLLRKAAGVDMVPYLAIMYLSEQRPSRYSALA